MEFDLITFTLMPTAEVSERCRKKDLLAVADRAGLSIDGIGRVPWGTSQ